MTSDKETIIKLAKEAGFIYHEEFTCASFAPSGRSIRPEGFKYGLEEIPFSKIEKMLSVDSLLLHVKMGDLATCKVIVDALVERVSTILGQASKLEDAACELQFEIDRSENSCQPH